MQSDRTHYHRAVALFELKRWRLCVREFAKHLAAFPHDANALAMSAAAWMNEGGINWPLALPLADAALAAAPGAAYCLYIRAIVAQYAPLNIPMRTPTAMRDACLDAAERFAREAIAADSQHIASWIFLARLAQDRARPKVVQQALEAALAIDPTHIEALQLKATVEQSSRRFAAADQTAYRVLQEQPDDPRMHTLLGWQMLRRGRTAKAHEHFLSALRDDPTNKTAKAGLRQSALTRFRPYAWLVCTWLWFSLGRGQDLKRPVYILVWGTVVLAITILTVDDVRRSDRIIALAILLALSMMTLLSIHLWARQRRFTRR